MALNRIIDPWQLLRISPLLLSTASITYAGCESHFFSVFLAPAHREKSNSLLPSWMEVSFYRVIGPLIGTYTLCAGLAGANAYLNGDMIAPESSTWYLRGMVFGLGHFAFVPLVAGTLERIMKDVSGGRSTEDMAHWLKIHRIRMVVADLPAWLCYIKAVTLLL
ncbi:hypothetical protein M501DRAFT_1016008 [Patellaria atrata CBS 101060]|uniref:Uncharacterized protein n=1 Tax=Patellaria atrata CBS 101060 TaxID=1346257 RepID=A0A9P4VQJ8_9PEZI|nr:hypothetical protein M501DRAFT_1016008 [Patellaria atrata CBS 101060]